MRTPEEIKKGLECYVRIHDGKCPAQCVGRECELYAGNYPMSENAADALAYIQKLEDQIRDITKMVPKWIGVDDPPKKGGRCLILFENGQCCDAEYDEDIDFDSQFGEWIAIYHPDTLGYFDSEWRGYQDVTHWMPLPEPPKEGCYEAD